MPFKRPATGLAFCLFYLSSYFTNKYVLSVLKFTYPTLFQGSEVLSWLPASALFVGIIYSGSRALSRLPIPIFLTLHNAADVIFYGVEVSVQKEQNSTLKLCRGLILLLAAGGLPFNDPQFDIDGYFWALVHLLCVGAYKVFHKLWKPNSLSISEQQYINYAFSVVMLAFASHPTGDLFSALEFPLLYFYIFHSSCLASGFLGFLLTLHTMKLKNSISSGQYLAWNFLAKVITAGLSPFFFEIAVNAPTACCLLLAGFAEVFLLYIERTGI
ncbi:transmembrane protein 241 isoform X3 [Pantherophis guttatus]|uniref:Transmembrane protein 241 isoform X3 n=1 Tax=Pantherophis guttatus TaxID=94885 RepID=A0A6P9CM11_PANGU|nr:transmembrane protein 241 isoform X3 [Pantherophis guttatus]